MAPVALAFAVLETTDSASDLGIVLAARTIPLVILMLAGGVIADRFGRDLVISLSNVVSGASQATLAVLLLSGHQHLWELIVLSAVNGTAAAAAMPATNGLVPQLVPRELLQQANAMTSLTRAILLVIGPTIAALLVDGAGPGWALGIDALSWFVAAFLMLPVRLPPTTGGFSPIAELRAGWDLFRGTTWLWIGVAAFCVLNVLYEGGFVTLGPVRSLRDAST
jgi:MFS family permease